VGAIVLDVVGIRLPDAVNQTIDGPRGSLTPL